MNRLYIAGAFNAPNVQGVLTNMRVGMDASLELIKEGFATYVPWLDYQLWLMDSEGELTVEKMQANSLEWLKVSDAVLVLEGWEQSEGTKAEIKEAKKQGIPVFYSKKELYKYASTL
jgi:hypothetical protein